MAILRRLSDQASSGALLSGLHPRENLRATGVIAAINAELVLWNIDGCSSINVDMRGTFILSYAMEGSTDGTNWVPIPFRAKDPAASKTPIITSATIGTLEAGISGFAAIRLRCTSYTSGSAICSIVGSLAPLPPGSAPTGLTTRSQTTIGAAGAATTLTLLSPGAGVRHYLNGLRIDRFAAATLSAANAPITISSTNLPDTLAWSAPADAAAQGTLWSLIESWRGCPLGAVNQSTGTTISCPATPSVIWRITAHYFPAP
jgi:hypothetical protein